MASPIVLTQVFHSPNEAQLTWAVDSSIITASTTAILVITDIPSTVQSATSSVNDIQIKKYSLLSTELSGGSHVFYDLVAGNYVAVLKYFDNTTYISSLPIIVYVDDLEAPVYSSIVPSDESFTFTLNSSPNQIIYVTFILLSRLIIGGDVQIPLENSTYIRLDYSSSNTYVINNLQNDLSYEISCFYTNSRGVSSELSESIIAAPTDAPNQITESAAIYDSVGQTLTITHNMPSNAADYDLIDCRATITNTVTHVVTYYYSSENSALLVPAPTAADPIVFNMNNQSLLPVDAPFTVTLSVKNEVGLWGPVESPALYCIHSVDYFAVSLVASNLTYSVGLDSITTSDNSTYVKNSKYVITYIADVFECDASGAIVGAAIASKTQDNMHFVFAQLVTGLLYKLVVNLKYDYTFVDATGATIHEHVANTCFYYFIPHDIPLALHLSATPGDGSVNVSWPDISTLELRGFKLDYYEVSRDNVTWISNGTATSYLFTGLSNGSSYIFYARAVSDSGSSLYMSGIDVLGETANITSVPYGAALAPALIDQMPGDSKCTVVWTNPATYNGGVFNNFQASVNNSSYVVIAPSFASDQYTFVFESLTNLTTTSIQIKIVTSNVSNINNVDTTKSSVPLSVTTIPFAMPDTPAGFVASPSATAVKLDWGLVLPAEIINNDVKYELYYKLTTDSNFTIVSDIITNTYSVTGLTSNLMYDFKIRSSILNDETGITFYSEFTEVIHSRPFVYSFAPNMTLVAGNAYIDVILSPNTNNYFQGTFKYSATISDIDGNKTKTATLSNIDTTDPQTIRFIVLGNGDELVNLEMVKVVSFYEMLNTDNDRYYSSSTTTSSIEPYDALLAPVLVSVSHDKMISLSLDTAVFNGYDDITGYQISFDNVSWADISMSSTVNLNVFTADITLDQNGVPLVNGSEYILYARVAFNINGGSTFSAASNMVTNIPYTTASAPTNLTSEPGNQQVTLSWSAPSNLGGLGLNRYEVKMDNNAWLSVGTDLSYIVTELTNGQSYTFYVRAVTIDVLEDNALVYGASASNVNIPYAAASAPIIVSCVESDEQLVLTWSEPSSLGGLTLVHYEVSSDDGFTWVSVELATSKTFTGLVNGQAYMLRVKAFTVHPYLPELVEGATLVTDPFYPYRAASAPIFVSCVEGDSQLVLTWSEPTYLGGLTLDHYEVSIYNASNYDGLNWVPVGLATSYTFTGLENGQPYSVRSRAVTKHPNLGSIIGYPLETTSFYPYTAASVPIFVSCVESDSQLVLTWSEPSSLGGLTLDHYEVSSDDGLNWVSVGLATSKTFDGLVNGQAYMLRVKAFTQHIRLGSVELIEGATLVTEPFYPYAAASAPIFVNCVEGDSQLVFSWLPPSSLGGLEVEDYKVSSDDGLNWVSVGLVTSYPFTGLVNGQAYMLRVKAFTTHMNLGSVEGATLVTESFYPYKASSPPQNLISEPADEIVVFSWTAAEEIIYGLPFVTYQVSTDDISWTDISTNTYSLTGINGVALILYVRFVTNHPNKGLILGENASATNIPYAIPSKVDPTSYTTDQYDADKQLIFFWGAVPESQLGGLPLDSYQVSKDAGVNWVSAGLNLTYTFVGLTNGQTYLLLAKAVVSHQYEGLIDGLFDSNDAYSATPYTQAAAPANIVATPGDTVVSLTWDAVTDLGGLPLTAYIISMNPEDPGAWQESLTNSYTFIGLTNGQSYDFTIAAKTEHPQYGEVIGYTSVVTNSIPYALPEAPVLISVIGDEQLELSWSTPDLGGLSLYDYRFSRDGTTWFNLSTTTDPNVVFVGSALSSSVSFINLTNGQYKIFYIAAVTSHPVLGLKQGAFSTVSAIPFGTPGQVSNIDADPKNYYMSFQFDGPIDTNNNAFTQYYDYSIDNGITFKSLSQLTSFTTAIGDDIFTLSIRCYIFDPNDSVTKIYGIIQELAGLQNTIITTVENLDATVSDGTVALSWDAVSDTIFQVIRYFNNGTTSKADTTDNFYTFSGLTNGIRYKFGVAMYKNGVAGAVANISAIPATKPTITSVSRSEDNLLLNIGFGGSPAVYIEIGAFTVAGSLLVSQQTVSMTVFYITYSSPIIISNMNYNNYYITASNLAGSTSSFYSMV